MSTESTPSKLVSKRKQPEENSEPSLTAEPKQKKPKKSKDKSKNDVAKSEGETETVKEETKEDKKARKAAKKAQKEAAASLETAQPEPAPSTSIPETQVASEQQETATKVEETPTAAPLEPKKKKERKRNKNNRKKTEDPQAQLGNGTPEEDSRLTEQAQKGIQYAWLYKHRHPKSLAEGDAKDDGTYWKFNKARQGWLWKNVWNEEIIPANYAELVIEYLSSMQGQARQKLLDEAQKIVDTPVKSAEEPKADDATEADGEATEPSAQEGEDAGGEAESAEPVLPATVSPEKHRRAQLVVEALKATW